MRIEDIKEGMRYIDKRYIYGELNSYEIVTIDKVLKTKVKLKNGASISGYRIKDLVEIENLKKTQEEWSEGYKKSMYPRLKEEIGKSKLRLQTYKEMIEEIEKEMV